METAFVWIHEYEYPAIFLLLMLGIVGLPIPDETLLVFVGYLSFKGDLSAPLSLVSAASGSGCGITVSYILGRLFGSRVIPKLGPLLHLSETQFVTAQRRVNQWGKYALVVAYFVPGLRHLGAIAIGASGLRYSTFATFAYSGAIIWSGTFLAVGYFLGEEWVAASTRLNQTFKWIGIGAVVIVVGVTVLVMLRRRRYES